MFSDKNMSVLINVIGAVESGGQIYGNRRYNAYAAPYTNSPNEHTITLGWAQNYGYEAKRLIQTIYNYDPNGFKKIDTAGIQSMLSKDWVAIRWNPTSAQKAVLIKLIDSATGHKAQDDLFAEVMKTFIADCESSYTKNVKAVMMYCEIRHLGGGGPVRRIFDRCKGDYSLGNILNSLRKDQDDTSSNNQVGDAIYWSRHTKCREFIDKYAVVDEVKPKRTYKTAVKDYQKWVNSSYPSLAKKATGSLLDDDGSFGRLTRAASVAIWKYMLNKYFGTSFKIGNANFYSSCKKAAKQIDNSTVAKHVTLAKVLQGLLAGHGWYSDKIDGSIGTNSNKGINLARKEFGLQQNGKIDATLWYKLFNS